MTPLVSIITPSYNQGQFIEATILSVLNQTYSNIEYILIDGGSTDNTMDIVNKYRDRINIVIHEKDNGQSDAINKGFKLAKGQLVGWINSDDILYPECVTQIVNLYQQYPDGSIYYNACNDFIDRDGNVLETYFKIIPDKNHLVNNDYSIIQQGSFYVTKLVKDVGYLDASFHYCMDLELWLKLLNKAPIYHLDNKVPLSGFRRWEEAKTSTGGRFFFREIFNVLKANQMKTFSPNYLRLKWYTFKAIVKSAIK